MKKNMTLDEVFESFDWEYKRDIQGFPPDHEWEYWFDRHQAKEAFDTIKNLEEAYEDENGDYWQRSLALGSGSSGMVLFVCLENTGQE